MTTIPAMIEQVEQERKELAAVSQIPIEAFQPRAGHGESGRCNWCGQWSTELVMAEPALAAPNGNEIRPARYKGTQCCGGRHV